MTRADRACPAQDIGERRHGPERTAVAAVRRLEPLIDKVLSAPPLRAFLQRRALRAWRGTDAPLILCYGNVNRSPFAEHVARRRPDSGATSAGFYEAAGRPAAEWTVARAAAHGTDLSAHRSVTVRPALLDEAPCIFVFDSESVVRVGLRRPRALLRTHLLASLADEGSVLIPDPHGRDLPSLDRTLTRIAGAIARADLDRSAAAVPTAGSGAPRPAMGTITACLIVLNEEVRLPAALASVGWCDEIVVVDSGSTDRTREIARDAGATVVEHPWAGFGAQRNVALDHATSDWVIEVDGDERVSPRLRSDIERFLALPPPEDVLLCVLPLRDHLLGRALGPSAKYPRYRARMFRRGSYRHDETRLVHEGLWPYERVWAMRGDLEHEFASTWHEALGDVWAYARLESAHVDPLRSPPRYLKAIVARPTAKVAFRMVVDGGWRDGWRGGVRIGLEAAADALIFVRRATGRVPPRLYESDELTFGRRVWRSGPVRVVVVDRGRGALPFLRAARDAGADVAILTDTDIDGGDWLHVERIPRLGPLHIARGLDAIAQMRPVDQLVVGRARVPLILVPGSARGAVPPTNLTRTDPVALVAELQRNAR